MNYPKHTGARRKALGKQCMYLRTLILLLVSVVALGTAARAQDARPADIAEELVAQFEQWFVNLGTRGQVPRAFTGVTRDGRQLTIVLDGLPLDHAKRRDFLIWLCQKYSFVAYAYATRVMKTKASTADLVEALDIHASSFDKDVFLTLSVGRPPDGSIKYVRDFYLSDNAKERKDQIFSGLHRSYHAANLASSGEFEKLWAGWEAKAHWRRVNTQTTEPRVDDANALVLRALELYASGDCDASLRLSQKAADLLRARGSAQSAEFAEALVAQGLCHKRLAGVAEAERLYRQAIEIYESVQGPNGHNLAITLDNLASLYSEHGRLSEAEQLRLRALQIFRATLGPESPHIANVLQNLAVLYTFQGQLAKAQESHLQALAIAERAYGADSRQVGVIADNLAGVYRSQRRFDQAETFYLRAISIIEKVAGRDHPDTALALQNYAILLSETGRLDKAETNLKQALGINERLYGANHDTIAAGLNTLVLQYIAQQRWRDALDASRRSAAISVRLAGQGKASAPSKEVSAFRRLVQVAYSVHSSDPVLMNEGYIAAQRALNTEAGLALSQLAVRHAAGDGALARLVRERQDLIQELESRDKLLIAAFAKAPNQRNRVDEDALRSRIGKIDSRIDAIDLEMSKQFPKYTVLSKPTPLSIAATQALLHPDEVLLQYLDLQAVGTIQETGFAWLITKTDAQWIRLPLGTHGLARSVAALRCGLDATRWLEAGAKLCSDLLKLDAFSSRASLPFNLRVAFELYQALLGPFEAKIRGKHLLVVPSGALTSLPLSVLVTEKPSEALPRTTDEYRRAAWLGSRQPITVLPSVASLAALRNYARQNQADRPFLGFGNPLLDGDASDPVEVARAKRARELQQCSKFEPTLARVVGTAQKQRPAGRLFRGAQTADVNAIRQLSPLPETADELCAVARSLGVLRPDSEVLLGSRATEKTLKAMSQDGRLERYRIVQFATHGVLAVEAERRLSGGAEPALVLTPPQKGDIDDDGLLTASEIAQLKLNADWVVLSACNTAAGTAGDAEALSGLARAFFYAGTRALLVSHWEVASDAAVKLTTRAFAELKANPAIGRAEAFRISMRYLIDSGTAGETHPSVWAPFVVVGEGAR